MTSSSRPTAARRTLRPRAVLQTHGAHDPALQQPRALLGGLSPRQFMTRHWQRQPLLIRQAWPGVQPPASRQELFALCGQDDVESRCIEQREGHWRLRHGPLNRRQLPPVSREGWTLLVQGLDLHVQAAHDMLRAFDFLPQVRLDDLMVSYATDGGGVGPHVDSYDVFLLQVQGRRRWAIAPPGDDTRVPGLPLRILANFEPQQQWDLAPGDMLYLPPGWQHEGVALGPDCMTASIGFRAPTAGELSSAVLQRLADEVAEAAQDDEAGPWIRRHADPGLAATAETGAIPDRLRQFAHRAVQRLLQDEAALDRALGAWLTEPKPQVWFSATSPGWSAGQGVVLDRRTRMAHDARHLFINGEAFRIGGRDARLLRELANRRRLSGAAIQGLSSDAQRAIEAWTAQGWMHTHPDSP